MEVWIKLRYYVHTLLMNYSSTEAQLIYNNFLKLMFETKLLLLNFPEYEKY